MTRRALFIGHRLPEYDHDRGSVRVLELTDFLLDDGWDVSMLCPTLAGAEQYRQTLTDRGVAVYATDRHDTASLLEAGFDLAIIPFWFVAEEYIPLIRAASPRTRIIVDSIDLHFLRNSRRALLGDDRRLDEEFAQEAVRELNAYVDADAVLTVSEREANLLSQFLGTSKRIASVALSEPARPTASTPNGREGILFVGNFRHLPNREAVEYLCHEILPRVDPQVRAHHPVSIVGHALDRPLERLLADTEHATAVGFVPALAPYYERTRISVAPLLHGAGVKGKLIESMTRGVPAVSTTIGAEGLDLLSGEHLLIADDPAAFAGSIEVLLTDDELWTALARRAATELARRHDPTVIGAHFRGIVDDALRVEPLPIRELAAPSIDRSDLDYAQRFRQLVETSVPAGSRVAVVSKGDDAVVAFAERQGMHLPSDERGVWLGYHPETGDDAVAMLADAHKRGATHLALPPAALWWLDHYEEFRTHVETWCEIVRRDVDGVVYRLADRPCDHSLAIVGIVAPGTQGGVERLSELVGRSAGVRNQLWVPSSEASTPDSLLRMAGEAAAAHDVDAVLVVDSRVQFGDGWLDRFVTDALETGADVVQASVCEDARPPSPAAVCLRGVRARRTDGIWTGPVICIRPASLPDPRTFAVIDIDPVPWTYGSLGLHRLGAGERDRVLGVLTDGWTQVPERVDAEIAVAIASYDRSALLEACLDGFVAQDVPPDRFEVIVVDDGSSDDTAAVARSFADRLRITVVSIADTGRSAAKNLGLLAATAPIVLLFDDDDRPAPDLLSAHLAAHAAHPEPGTCILGHTEWDPSLTVTPLMHHVTEVGMQLFAYPNLAADEPLDYRHFWEGRISVPRDFLVRHGLHDQRLQYTIDIELGYRLAQHGLRIIYEPAARSHMCRPVDLESFAARCEAKGRAQAVVVEMHDDVAVARYCRVPDAAERWHRNADRFSALRDEIATRECDGEADDGYHRLLREYLDLCSLRGVVAARGGLHVGEPVVGRLSIVIPAWNVTDGLAEMTARTVDTIRKHAVVDTEIVVVDNGSPFRRDYDVDQLLEWPVNRGIAPAWNAGVVASSGEVVCLMNSDVTVLSGWDAPVLEAARDGSRIVFPYTDHGDGLGIRSPDQAGTSGWCFAMARSTYELVGPFDEAFAPAFFEDTDYFHRAWEAGVELNPLPDSAVHHVRRTTAKRQLHVDWLFVAHRHKYGWKHGVDPTSPPPFYQREIVEYPPA